MKSSFSRKLYTQIIRFYPEAFRAEFSDEMLSLFDECEPALGSRHLLQDVLISVARQQFRSRTMPKPAPINPYREASPTPQLARIFAISALLVTAVAVAFAPHLRSGPTEIHRSSRRIWYSRCADHPVSPSAMAALRIIELPQSKSAPK